MTNTLPDRLSIDPSSDHFYQEVLERGIGVRFKGRERKDVEEYCISERWIRVQAGKTVDRRGKPLTIKLTGDVEVWYENPPEGQTADDEQVAIASEENEGGIVAAPTADPEQSTPAFAPASVTDAATDGDTESAPQA